MENKNFKVSINSLEKVSKEIKIHHENIMTHFDDFNSEFSKLSDSFNTNSASMYQSVMEQNITDIKKNINDNNQYIINKLNEISNVYSDLYAEISGRVIKEERNSD